MAVGTQVIYRDVEESLDLVSMKIHGYDPVGTGSSEQFSHQLGTNGNPGFVFPDPGRAMPK